MFCKNCGTSIPEGATFCPNCGQKVPSELSDKAMEAVNGVVNMVNDTEKEVESVVNDVTNKITNTVNSGSYQGGANGTYNGEYQNNYSTNQGAPMGSGPLKTDRSLVSFILLTIITCGIYSYYFIYSIAKDVNIACEGDGKSTVGLGMFILLSIVTCGIYAWFWYYSLGNRLSENAPRYGLSFQENGTTVLLWLIFGSLICGIGPYVAMHILIKNTNAICVAYNQKAGFYGV